MPLDNITGYSITKKDPKDYSVVFVGQSGLSGKDNLTLGEAILLRDNLPKNTALIVRTTAMVGKCY